MDKNKIELTGTIRKLYRLKTKAGNPFIKVLLKVGKDTFWVLAYGNVASAITALKEGDPLGISGTAQINNWKTDAGEWRNDFNAVAWTAEIKGQQVKFEKAEPAKQVSATLSQQPHQQSQPVPPPPEDRDLSQYEYQGGPF